METKPSLSEFERMARQGNLIPVYREFLADTETPVSAYLKIKDKSFSFLLESADGAKTWGRYSFIGYKPSLIVLSRGGKMQILEGNEKKMLEHARDPLQVLRDLTDRFKPVRMQELATFQGGLVGYINYDLIRAWEHLPGVSSKETGMPELLFTFSRRLIIFDHLTHRIKVIVFVHLRENTDLKEVYGLASREVNETISELQQPLSRIPKKDRFAVFNLESNFRYVLSQFWKDKVYRLLPGNSCAPDEWQNRASAHCRHPAERQNA